MRPETNEPRDNAQPKMREGTYTIYNIGPMDTVQCVYRLNI